MIDQKTSELVAVIGMSCRFPNAKNIQEYWELLTAGEDAIRFFTEEELINAGVSEVNINDPDYVPAGYVIDDIDKFDHQLFRYNPLEAERIDPQQRKFLECSWECIEDSGYNPKNIEVPTGVFAGVRTSSYLDLFSEKEKRNGTTCGFQILIGNDKDYLSSRVAYKLNLKGPSVTVQTACSTSLVALHLACESIRNYECEMAIAGGVALSVPTKQGYFYQKDMTFSPDGECRAFDANGKGVTGSNGVGCVLLKRLDLAIRDHDHIYAIIRGTAVNNDGQEKIGYTAPSIDGQSKVINEALMMSDINPEKIGYIETHGTATKIGDPIEIEALVRAFSKYTSKKQYCALGSVKTNIGHLGEAAGIAGFIKAVLSVYHGYIPPSLHFRIPNSNIKFEETPFYVCNQLTQWNDINRYAGISSFGIGGTNAHVVLQNMNQLWNLISHDNRESGEYLFVLSAIDDNALRKLAGNLKIVLENSDISYCDVAFTLATGREHMSRRIAFLASSNFEACSILNSFIKNENEEKIFKSGNQKAPISGSLEDYAFKYANGETIDWMNLFADKKFNKISLPTYPFATIKHWKEKCIASNIMTSKSISPEIWRDITNFFEEKNREPDVAILDKLDVISIYRTTNMLLGLGAFENPEERLPLEGFLFQTPIMPKYNQFLQWLLEELVSRGILFKENEEYYNLIEMQDEDFLSAYDYLSTNDNLLTGEKNLEDIMHYYDQLGDYLSGMLDTGEAMTFEINALGLAETINKINQNTDNLWNIFVKTIPENFTIRILEISTYRPNKNLQMSLKDFKGNVNYCFISLSNYDLSGIEFAENIEVNIIAIDSYNGLTLQEEEKFDVIYLANTLYAVPDVKKFMNEILNHTAPEGYIIIEDKEPNNFTFTMLETFLNRIEDNILRSSSPYLKADQVIGIIKEHQKLERNILLTKNHEYLLVCQIPENSKVGKAFSSALPKSERSNINIDTEMVNSVLGIKYPTSIPIFENKIYNLNTFSEYTVVDIPIEPVSFFYNHAKILAQNLCNMKKCCSSGKMFSPIRIDCDDRVIQTVVTNMREDNFDFEIYSKNSANQDLWELHYRGSVKKHTKQEDITSPNILKECDECKSLLTKEEVYETFKKQGVEYSEDIQIIDKIFCGGSNKIVAKISLPDNCQQTSHYICEACIQAALSMIEKEKKFKPSDIWFLDTYSGFYINEEYEHDTALILVEKNIKGNLREEQKYSVKITVYNNSGIQFAIIKDATFVPYSSYQLLMVFPDAEIKTKNDRELKKRLQNTDPEKQNELLQEYLIHTFSNILRIEPSEISLEDDFIQMGLDSLMFLELNQTLSRDIGINITAQEAFGTPYISSLVKRISKELLKMGKDLKSLKLKDPVEAIGGVITPDLENRYEPFDLTNVQYAYWIGRSGILDLGNVSCHFYFEVDRDELDISIFSDAWNKVVRRHDMLRSYILPGGKQKILKDVPYYNIETVDLREVSESAIEARLEKLRYDKSHQVISSEEWPLFDITICLLPTYYRILFSIELLNADVMSIQIMFNEVEHYMNDQNFLPEPLQLSFRDYILADKRLQETELYEIDKKYWLDQIKNMSDIPDLPLIKDLSNVCKQRFSTLVRKVEPEVWAAVKKKAAKRGITPSGLLLAIYGDVLALWSRNSKFIISLAQFNRIPYHPDVFNIVGDFTSIMIMDIDTKAGETFSKRAKNIQDNLWRHLEHRHFDGVQVIRELARGKRAGNDALIPVVFTSVLGMGEQSEELYPWAVLGRVGYFVSQTPQVWLDNQVSESNGTLIISWDVIEELFPRGMLNDMINCYELTIRDLAANDEIWNFTREVKLPEWQNELFEKVNNTREVIPQHTLVSLFHNGVKISGKAPAIFQNDRVITYLQLETCINNIANELLQKGVKKGDLVAIIMEKGWQQIAAALGIMTIGAIYLPINADLPKQRIDFLLRNSGAECIITQTVIDSDFLKMIIVEDNMLQKSCEIKFNNYVTSDDIAYVIYTSGSTGKPKGVSITQRGAVNTIMDINTRYHITAGDKVLGLSAMNFDLSVYDVFGLLAVGGSIVIPDKEKLKDPQHWWELIDKYDITIWNSVPVLMEMLLNDVHQHDFNFLRLVLLSGDWIPVSLPSAINNRFKNAKIISLGGATEASIWSILYPIDPKNSNKISIPYGKPMKNQYFRILKDDLSVCPVWVSGELFIGGDGLATGYWKNPERTAESFIANPQNAEILYKTGDYGRYLPDGNIEFLGRADTQVKIRGNRVELGEIEALLLMHPQVKNAVVDILDNGNSDKILNAFIVPEDITTIKMKKNDFPAIMNEFSADSMVMNRSMTKLNNILASSRLSLPESASDGFQDFLAFMCSVTKAILRRIFNKLGVFMNPNSSYTIETLVKNAGIIDQYRELLVVWVKYMFEQKLLIKENENYKASQKFCDMNDNLELLNHLDRNSYWYDKAKMLIEYFRETDMNYAEILLGNIDPLEFLIHGNGPFTAQAMEQFNPLDNYFRELIGKLIINYLKIINDRNSCIVEIGTRANSVLGDISSKLSEVAGKYCYTDSSPVLLEKMKKLIPENEQICYALLDFNGKLLVEQGWMPHSVDIIVASNTLHRAYDLQKAIKEITNILKPGGIFIIYENIINNPLQLVTVALFEDDFAQYKNHREGWQTLLSIEEWKECLSGKDINEILCYPMLDDNVARFGQQIFVAQITQKKFDFDEELGKKYLSENLPDYMVPNHIYCMDSLPITENGKIDRKALKQFKNSQRDEIQILNQYHAPESQYEKDIATIWKQILNTQNDDIDTDFISAGGDSLQAVQFANRIRKQYTIDFSLKIVFNGATIRTVAAYIDEHQTGDFEEGEL